MGLRFPDLLAAAHGGDEQAFAVLWPDLQPAVLRYFQVVAAQAAEDLAADTWMALIGGLGRSGQRLAPPGHASANRPGPGGAAGRAAGAG